MATATNVTGTAILNLSFLESITSGVITAQQLNATIGQAITYANGTGALGVDYIYGKQLSLAGSATTLDLTSLTDLGGGSVNFARVRLFCVVNLATTAAYTLTVGPGVSNPWTTGPWGASSSLILQPSPSQSVGLSHCLFQDPYQVGATTGWYTSGTSKTVKLDPGANTLSCYVLIVGGSAVS